MESAGVATEIDDKRETAASGGVGAAAPSETPIATELQDHDTEDVATGATSTSEPSEASNEGEDYAAQDTASGTSSSEPAGAPIGTEIGHEVNDMDSGSTSSSKAAETPIATGIDSENDGAASGAIRKSEPAGAQFEIGGDHETGDAGSGETIRSEFAGVSTEAAEMDRRKPSEASAETKTVPEVEDSASGAASRTETLTREDQVAESSSSQDKVSDLKKGKEKWILDQGQKAVEAAESAASKAEQGSVGSLNGFTDYEERKRQQRDHDVQLAMRMADAVEEDAHAVARSLTALLSSLRSALSEVTRSSVAHMRIENEAAGQVQDAAIDAVSKGNRFVNDCLRLNEEMKGMDRVASQLQALKVKVDHVESQASRYISR
ncbi:hypothetical protein R1flu_028063 [Riccia fluitans]|uniref:BLOC-1-related complex subunit 6 C-terminal helix domain-containing protein n=1 Tax=Riccia fluitans TaxID=41844 RepID=A0ABD1XL31_9MARC